MGASRPSVYTVDGTGRDGYIARDNGGLYTPHKEAPCTRSGSFGTRNSMRGGHMATNPLESKKSNYHARGTGRDSYIS
jgi:hypothetical protein